MKINRVTLITTDSSYDFTDNIKQKLDDGWELQGSPYTTNMYRHNQLMVKVRTADEQKPTLDNK
jgi:hypothetical protein